MIASAHNLRRDIAEGLIRPREKLSPVESSKKYVKVKTPSGGISDWSAELTPYIVEPMNCTASRLYSTVVYVGASQGGKTQGLILGEAAHVVKTDPSDFGIVQTTKETARKFDKTIKRMFRNSPELKKELVPGRGSENTYDKILKDGSIIYQVWPSISNLSGATLKYMLLTDYDRMPQDIDGEGTPYSLAVARTKTFLSKGMTVVESSPGFEILDPTWKPKTPHEAPPCAGILSLFNMGDRRRYYVQCPECKEYYLVPFNERALSFRHERDLLGATLVDIIQDIKYVCTKNGCLYGLNYKRELNKTALWVPEGCEIENNKLQGDPIKSEIASFWHPGVFAAYSNVAAMVKKFLDFHREYDLTGEERNLKTCINTDFGAPYLRQNLVSDKDSDEYKNRAEDVIKKVVPVGVRFLMATIDVQGWGFEVQVIGYGVGNERWIIDRYEISVSERTENGKPVKADPAVYLEDWELITTQVLTASYSLDDNSKRVMQVALTVCDSGGKKGVTARAYDYWRSLKKRGLHKKFALVKGERPKPERPQPTVRRTFPENNDNSAKKANARGEIPLFILNTTVLKDTISNDLNKTEHGKGYIHFPTWLKDSFFEELTAEKRNDDGWINPANARNETFDLLCYGDAAIRIKTIIDGKRLFDWDNPPKWALEWDNNPLVIEKENLETTQQIVEKPKKKKIFKRFEQQDDWL